MSQTNSKINATAKRIDGQIVDAGKVFGMKPNTAWIVFGIITALAIVGAVVIFR